LPPVDITTDNRSVCGKSVRLVVDVADRHASKEDGIGSGKLLDETI
jgi:hypothetical protein